MENISKKKCKELINKIKDEVLCLIKNEMSFEFAEGPSDPFIECFTEEIEDIFFEVLEDVDK